MKKLIKIDFDNTTRERKTEDSYSELYSYDKNNGSFEFEILNDTLTTEQVTALFKFTESNKIWKTTGTVEGNKVHVTFDTTLITQNETVICYLYFDEEQRTSDTFRFKFKVKVSEIDKMSRYEVKERFINNTVIVDRLDVVTKDELKEALKNVGGVATEGLLTEVKAEELYAKKSEAVDNTNFELVKNRVLALELKTDKDTVYDDREVKERLTTLENKQPVDLSGYATKEELQEVRNSQPTVDTSHLVTRDELDSKGYVTDLSEYAKKSELYNDSDLKARVEVLEQKTDKDTVYDDTPLKERVTALESKAIEGGAYDDSDLRNRVVALENKEDKDTKYDDTEVKRRLTEIESKPAIDTSVFVTENQLNEKGYLTQHQSLDQVVTKDELASKNYISDISNLVTKDELASKNYLTEHQPLTEVNNRLDVLEAKQDKDTVYNDTELRNRVTELESRPVVTPYNDTPLKERVEVLENKVDKDTVYNDSELRERVTNLENKPNVDLTNYVTNEQLENKHYLTQHQPLDNLVTKEELNSKGYVTEEVLNGKGYVTEEVLNGKNYLTEDVLSTKNYLTQHQDLSSLVTKQELENKHYLTEHQNISHLVTKEELETKGYLTQHQSLEEYAKKSELYNDTEVKQRLATLENKPNIDTSNFVTNEQLEGKHYLTEHQPLTHLATTSDLEVLRNISVNKAELSKKVDTTEYNSFKDSVVTKSELAEKGYISDLSNYVTKQELHEATEIDYSNIVTTDELEGKHYLTANDISNLATKQELQDKVNKSDFDTLKDDVVKHNELAERHYLTETTASDIFAKKSELPQPYNDSALVSRVTALESRPNSENGHSLNTNVRIEGTFKNGVTSQLNLFADVFFDGEVVTSGYTLDYYYRGFGNNNWQVLNNQTADSTGRFGTWGAQRRNGEYFEVRIVVSYRGLKATSFARLDNVVDGVINQQNNRPLRYWCGTQAQYDAIQYKDVNTIYDIFKQV